MVCQERTSNDSIAIEKDSGITLQEASQVAEKELPGHTKVKPDAGSGSSLNLKKNQSVIKSALSMAAGTFSSRILGFVRDALMFAFFPRGVTDAFVVAFRLPNMFRRLLGEGSLSVSFIPVYVESRAKGKAAAEHLANAVFTIVMSLSVVITVVCFVYMDQIVNYLVNDPRGFGSIPGKVEQTIYLARIMIFYLVLVTTYAFHMAIANTLGHFFWPAVGPTLFNLGLIIFTLLPEFFGAFPGSTQSLGVVVGGFLQMGVVAWVLIKEGHLPSISFRWRDPAVGKVFANMLPGLFGLGVFQVMTIVNTKFAARLAEGAQSYIYAADRVLELPQSLIAVSLGAALLPRFSELHTSGEKGKFLAEANQAVRMLLYLSLPAAVGMYVLALPITEVLFMRGSFTAADAVGTSAVVQVYAFLMLFSSWSRVTAPAFYALKNTWLPASVALFVLILHISVGPYLVDHYGLQGLAAATSASAVLNIFILQVLFNFWIGPMGYMKILVSVAKLIPGLAAMGVFCFYAYPFILQLLIGWSLPPSLARTLDLTLVISCGMILYFYVSVLSKSETALKVFDVLRRRFGRGTAKA